MKLKQATQTARVFIIVHLCVVLIMQVAGYFRVMPYAPSVFIFTAIRVLQDAALIIFFTAVYRTV